MKGLLAELCGAQGIPGYEGEVLVIMARELKQAGYRVEEDNIGNMIAWAPGSRGKKNPVMFGAHMDEIGLMVKFVNDLGFIRFIKLGGIDDRVLLNQRVVIKTEKGEVFGVIGSKPPHYIKEEEAKKTIEYETMFIDVGAKDRKDADKLGVKVGDPIFFDLGLEPLANNRITGKALDNRVGCYILIEVAKALKNKNVVLVGTTQEEVSTFGKGAKLSAYHIEPKAFIAVDVSIAGDHPEMREHEGIARLDKGPAITLVEAGGRGNMADRQLIRKVAGIARKAKIPYQLEVTSGGATDAASVYGVRGGIPCIAFSVPTRYIHSNVAVCGMKDIELTAKLVEEVGKKLG